MAQKYLFDSIYHYTIYNENDLKAIFGDDAVLVPSPPGLLTITYKRGGVYKFWGMLHGLVVADSARKAITITNGGFISPEEVGVNIAGDEVKIDARNPARSAFKISRDGVYVQNEYFIGCEPEQEITATGCRSNKCIREYDDYEGCEVNEYAYVDTSECDLSEMMTYRIDIEEINKCEIDAVVAPQYANVNMSGMGFISAEEILDKSKGENYNSFIEALRQNKFLIVIENLKNIQIEESEAFSIIASAPEGGSVDFTDLKSDELFRYSEKEDSTINTITGDMLDLYSVYNVRVKVEDVGNSPHPLGSRITVYEGSRGSGKAG